MKPSNKIQPGEEYYEVFFDRKRRKMNVLYQYVAEDCSYFEWRGNSLEECRAVKDRWEEMCVL